MLGYSEIDSERPVIVLEDERTYDLNKLKQNYELELANEIVEEALES